MDGCGFLHWRFFDYDFRFVRIFIYCGIYEVVKHVVGSLLAVVVGAFTLLNLLANNIR